MDDGPGDDGPEILNSDQEEEFQFPARRQGVLISQPHVISPLHMQIHGNRDSVGSFLGKLSLINNQGSNQDCV